MSTNIVTTKKKATTIDRWLTLSLNTCFLSAVSDALTAFRSAEHKTRVKIWWKDRSLRSLVHKHTHQHVFFQCLTCLTDSLCHSFIFLLSRFEPEQENEKNQVQPHDEFMQQINQNEQNKCMLKNSPFSGCRNQLDQLPLMSSS